MSEPWTRYWIKDPFWGGIDHLIQGGVQVLSVEAASRLGAKLGVLAGEWRFRHLRERVMGNLRRIVPEKPQAELEALAQSMWANLGRTLMEMTMLDRLSKREFRFADDAALRAVRDRGRPIIFVFPHLANWEILAIALVQLGLPPNVVFEHLRNRFQRRMVRASRKRIGYPLITPDFTGTREVHRVMRDKGIIGIGMDEFANGNVMAPAFGRNIAGRNNLERAVRLAAKYGGLIIPIYCERTNGVQFDLRWFTPVEPVVDGDPAARQATVQQLNDLCESWIRTRPDQWYMLHRMRLRS